MSSTRLLCDHHVDAAMPAMLKFRPLRSISPSQATTGADRRVMPPAYTISRRKCRNRAEARTATFWLNEFHESRPSDALPR